MRRPLPGLAGTLTLVLVAAGTPARATTVAPPGNSAVSQYLETVPTAAGGRPSNSIPITRLPAGTLGRTGASPVSPLTLRRLSAAGATGVAAARLALAAAPRPAPARGKATGTPIAVSPAPVERPARTRIPGAPRSALASVFDVLGGSGSGLGPLLPILLLAGLIWALGASAVRRRR